MITHTIEEFETRELARLYANKQKWEIRCSGCKHLKKCRWDFAGKSGITYSCGHPDRQTGFDDPRPYGCGGSQFEK